MILILTENRAKAKMLAKPFESQDKQTHILTQSCSLFPEGAVFLWTDGHVISLAEPAAYQPSYADWLLDSLPIIPSSFKYTVLKDKTEQFTICQRFLTAPEVSQVILATDRTEDGEVIGQLIRVLSGCKKPVRRMWLHSLAESEIEKAFMNLQPSNAKVHLFNASMARRYADWLVNTNATRFYTLLNQQQSGQEETFSVDRIHTALISHIIKREDTILSFKSAPFYEVVASFIYQGSIYQGKWFKAEIERLQVEEQASALANFCSGKTAKVVSVTKERHEEKPPPFLTLSTIQTQANQYYGLSPQEVFEACERLYFQGLLSCPVTENPYITEEQANTFPDLLNKLQALPEYESITPDPLDLSSNRYVDDRNCCDYCAIIPTGKIPNIDELSDKERKIYDLVLRSIVASFHSKAVFEETTIITLINNSFSFRTKNRFLVEPGWKQVYQVLAKEETVDKSPCVIEGQNVIVAQMNIKQEDTLPPERFSEIELIQLMKNKGFATPAMRSSIISMLKERYIALKNQQVYPLEKGRRLINLIGNNVLTSIAHTAEWENKIQATGEGKVKMDSFLAEVRALTSSLFPNRKDIQVAARGKSKPISDAQEQQELPVEKQPIHQEGQHNERSISLRQRDSVGPCKRCGADVVDKGSFFGCSAYKTNNCSFTISKTILGVKLREKDIEALLTNGATPLIKGFAKEGKEPFDAVLKLQGEKLIFSYPNVKDLHLPIHLLNKDARDPSASSEHLEEDFLRIEKEMAALKYPGKVVNVTNGPRVTRFSLLPQRGLNINGYKRFKSNLQAALRAERLTLYIPLPGTNTVGIEVPNRFPYPVYLRTMLENKEYLANRKNLYIPLGMDVEGNPVSADLTKMPHLLVAGTTGSGKSVFINSVINSLLYACSSDDLKLVLVDVKQVELSVYEELPQLLMPIATDAKQASFVLKKLIGEMERRYAKFSKAGVKNIESYNAKAKEKLPFIVLVVDELADLLMVAPDEVEDSIQRLAQLARAAGIHMILATQRPTKQVLSTTIKANLPVRIAFSVASTSDSMTILDAPGAEELLGRGDMFYRPSDIPRVRLQSPYVSDSEIYRVTQYLLKNQ